MSTNTILSVVCWSVGGVTLLRAAAKNHARVTVICDPGDYDRLVGNEDLTVIFKG